MYDIKERSIETVYTLEEARKIIKAQDLKMANYRRAKVMPILVQKLIGLGLVVLGCLVPVFLDGDATASVVIVPAGLGLMFTRSKVINL